MTGARKAMCGRTMKFAGAAKLPVVFVVNNKQWVFGAAQVADGIADTGAKPSQLDFAASRSTATTFLPCAVAAAAIASARAGEGPRLIEAVIHRHGGHTTADDASRYRRNKKSRRPGSRNRSCMSYQNRTVSASTVNLTFDRSAKGALTTMGWFCR